MDRTGLEEAIRRAADPVMLMQRVADEAMTLLEGADGVFVGLANDAAWLTLECGSGYLKEQIGGRIPLDGSLAGLAFRTGETLRCDDAESDSRVELDLCHAFHVVSAVCACRFGVATRRPGCSASPRLGRGRSTTAMSRRLRASPSSSAS